MSVYVYSINDTAYTKERMCITCRYKRRISITRDIKNYFVGKIKLTILFQFVPMLMKITLMNYLLIA